jgi:hypothetical protein
MALRKIPYPEAPRAKRGLEGRTTFFRPYGIIAEPLLFRPTLLRPRPCNLRLGATQGYRGVRQPALRSQQQNCRNLILLSGRLAMLIACVQDSRRCRAAALVLHRYNYDANSRC